MRLSYLAPALSLVLAGCVSSPPPRAPASMAAVQPGAPADEVLWARKDGQRMSGNPVLYEQGVQDRQRCALESSPGGVLDFPIFASCMDSAGYRQMPRRG